MHEYRQDCQCYRCKGIRVRLQTHFGLGAEAILDITYDYDGPNGVQRKFVKTVDVVYVYYAIAGQWEIRYNLNR